MSTPVKTTNYEVTRNSLTGSVIIITIPNPAADKVYGTSTPCRTCYVSYLSGTQPYMNIDTAAAAATGWKLDKTAGTPPFEVPIDDVNKLHFFGTAGDKIQILWRN